MLPRLHSRCYACTTAGYRPSGHPEARRTIRRMRRPERVVRQPRRRHRVKRSRDLVACRGRLRRWLRLRLHRSGLANLAGRREGVVAVTLTLGRSWRDRETAETPCRARKLHVRDVTRWRKHVCVRIRCDLWVQSRRVQLRAWRHKRGSSDRGFFF